MSSERGDAAKMREALGFMAHLDDDSYTSYDIAVAIQKANAALAAPPRNCDLYATEAEARKAFIVWYNTVYDLNGDKYEVESCDLKHNVDGILHDYITWLFTEAEGDVK